MTYIYSTHMLSTPTIRYVFVNQLCLLLLERGRVVALIVLFVVVVVTVVADVMRIVRAIVRVHNEGTCFARSSLGHAKLTVLVHIESSGVRITV